MGTLLNGVIVGFYSPQQQASPDIQMQSLF